MLKWRLSETVGKLRNTAVHRAKIYAKKWIKTSRHFAKEANRTPLRQIVY